ncbi:cleavage and polyadenylation specificity factor subunit 6 [Scleropages formosus]|uniref:cleavage and polyadenylation specificity factor subunit 6 n=1 Tax=Scleropages formosus TaxID=113540 RepID=UPI0010FA8A41|nr:cleavage and polyadenylation specificity factor subunit 6-like [Scleropages formosus]
MEAGLSVALLRDQLGAVIEQAVTAAVETVLGEMARLVGSKFEEFRKEMSAKEKENESIKQMLEISRCQMKTLRKYLSAVGAKEERQLPGSRSRSGQQSCGPLGELQGPPAAPAAPPPPPVNRPKGPGRAAPPWDRGPSKFPTSQGPSGEGAHGSPGGPSLLKAEGPPEGHGGPCLRNQGGREAAGGAKPPAAAQEGRLEAPCSNPSPVSKAAVLPAADTGSQTAWGTSLQPKKEEEEEGADIDVICIKEEPEELEACSLEPRRCPASEVSDQGSDLADQQDGALPPVVPSEELMAAFTLVSPGTYPDVRSSLAGPLQQTRRRQWLGDACEDYRHRKAELKRRSQHRRRELEKNLPQPLLNALVRERREKTRLRVARWRAKRKLQASLMAADAAQFSCPPMQTVHGQRSDPLRCQQQPIGVPQFSGLLYSNAHSDSGAHYPGLQFNSHPLLPGLRHNIANAVMQPGVMSSTQQAMLGADVLRTEPSGPPEATGGLTAGILKP